MRPNKEQVEKMAQVMCGYCTDDKRCILKYSAPCSDIASQDCTCKESAEELIYKGYGNVSEYKAEIERLKDENCELTEKLKARLTCDFVKTAQKQAQIDVLNKAKEKLDSAPNGWAYTGYIDDLIEEIENETR